MTLAEDVYSEKPVFMTDQYTGADIEDVCKRQEGLPYLIIFTQKDIKQMHFLKAIAQTIAIKT